MDSPRQPTCMKLGTVTVSAYITLPCRLLRISNKSVAVPRQDSICPCRDHAPLSGHCKIYMLRNFVHVSLRKPEFGIYIGEVLSSVVEVSTDDPRVVQVMKDAESKARKTHLPITTEMYIRALKKGIQDAEQKRREADPTGPL